MIFGWPYVLAFQLLLIIEGVGYKVLSLLS